MEGMRFAFSLGMYPMGMPKPGWIYSVADRLEERGFDAIAMGDHIVFTNPNMEALTMLAAFASRTTHLGLMTNVLLLPLRNPAVVAKIVSSIDYLSGGRVILGIGVGGESTKEFELCGVPLGQRGARTDEGLEILRKLWAEGSASHSGRFWQFEDVAMEPKPVQAGGPPIWIGGRSDKALQRAVRYGDGWMGYAVTPERYAASVEKIREFGAAEGRDMSNFRLGHALYICSSSKREEARDLAVRYMTKVYNQPSFEQLVDKYCLVGTPQECIKRIERYVEHGARFIVFRATCPPDDLMNQIDIYAKEIIPYFRR